MGYDYIFLGPRCDYNPDVPICPSGQTWKELELYRAANRAERQLQKDLQRKSQGLEPEIVDPYQIYTHPYLTGQALEDVLKRLVKKPRHMDPLIPPHLVWKENSLH